MSLRFSCHHERSEAISLWGRTPVEIASSPDGSSQ
jgi:hypothetical protein